VIQGPCLTPSQKCKMPVARSASKTRSSVRHQRTTRNLEGGAVFAGDPNPSAHITAPNADGACSRWVRSALSRPPWRMSHLRLLRTCRSSLPLVGRKMHRAHLPLYRSSQLLMHACVLQGFRTYPSFLHFLASVTLLATYVAVICIRGLTFAFRHPVAIVRVELNP